MNLYIKLILYLFVIFILKIINKYLIPSVHKIKKSFNSDRLKYGLVSKYFLSNLTNSEFENYCKYFLENRNFKDITNISKPTTNGLTLTCKDSNNSKIHINCFKANCKNENNIGDNYESIGQSYIEEFIGVMVHDKITHGMIITNGNFTSETKKHVQNLPPKYNVELIDGTLLSSFSWQIREKIVMKLSSQQILTQ
ncbi:restriction endonuclease [Clostridium aestuarii]|uniref:Restriction endonuclease n=1 Tax=Clostridium aestuarii TaxID=338193 RepID=A0ABT4CYM2_9CLOT|nr:restriction endonuclease [Clostridium aestuarii]MCY6484079.1 restriction endonuclease [Clostridium aestuarii]